jgi:hypothetical protein
MGPSCVHYRDRSVPVAVRISTNDGSLFRPLLGSFRAGSLDPLGTNLRNFENHFNYK